MAPLVAALVDAGVEPTRAEAEVAALVGHPALLAARVPALVARLRTANQRHARLDVRPGLDVDTLLHVHVALGVPVLAPGFCADWPALARWTPAGLVERAGDVAIEVVVDADDPHRDRHWRRFSRRTTLADYVDRVEGAPAGNALYMLANHRNLTGPLAALLDDVRPPEGLMASGWATSGGASLWYGPAGTHTPTHHDTTSVVFCQVRGRKRIWLAPPDEARLPAARDGFYSPIALSDPGVTGPGGALEGGCVLHADVGPGDMLLLPAGWWHEVLALDTSVSVGLVGLAVPNRFDDHRPGFPAR